MEHIREIEKWSKRKRRAENTEHIREIEKQAKRKRRAENLEHIREVEKRSRSKRNQKVENIEQRKEIKKSGDKVISMMNLFHNEIKHGPEYVCTCCDHPCQTDKMAIIWEK